MIVESWRYELDANRGPTDLSWESHGDIEVTLGNVCFDRMTALGPSWIDIFDESQRQGELNVAVQNGYNVILDRHIRAWIHEPTSDRAVIESTNIEMPA